MYPNVMHPNFPLGINKDSDSENVHLKEYINSGFHEVKSKKKQITQTTDKNKQTTD